MVNYESALTDGTCRDAQSKQYVFYAPPSVVTAFKGAGVTLITEANKHGEDCGPPGLLTATATRPGLASAYDVNDLVAAVEAARKTADTVIVYLHWGTELDACPNPCTNVSATPGTPVATVESETSPASPTAVQTFSVDSG
jgi:poly-gamma-glutamate capsule biosynthesis protein CapA/YwtB (metallophosphatase superfamily)